MEALSVWSASSQGRTDIVQDHIESGSNIDFTDSDGHTPLLIAACAGHVDVVDWLIQHGADINKASQTGQIPLWMAASNGRAEVVKLLLNAGCNVNKATRDRCTPLQAATVERHGDVVDLLIKYKPKCHNKMDDGKTLLHLGVYIQPMYLRSVISNTNCAMHYLFLEMNN